MIRKHLAPALRLAGAAALLGPLVVGCAGARSAAPATAVRVELHDFRIVAPATLAAGTARFELTGVGPTMHEFNVARTDLPLDQLPTAPSGILIDADGTPAFEHVGEAEGIDIGGHKVLTVDLTPGRYVLYCNMEGHASAGMVATLVVSS